VLQERALGVVGDVQKLAVVGPAQFNRHCLLFLVRQVEPPHVLEVRDGEAPAHLVGEPPGEPPQRAVAILGAVPAVLLVDYDHPAVVPVCPELVAVHVLCSHVAGDLRDPLDGFS